MTDSLPYNLRVPERGDSLVRTFFRLVQENDWNLSRMCQRAGISRRSPYYWRHSHTPHLGSFVALLQVAGLELVIVDSATGEVVE